MKQIIIIALATLPLFSMAQKSKVQAAWRALNDYEGTLNDVPEFSYLTKAKENIDLALANDETKNTAKANAYKVRIMFDIYQYNLKQETKKAEVSIKNKIEAKESAYVTSSTADFNEAYQSIVKLKSVDAKYFEKTLGPNKIEADLMEDELKLYHATNQMKGESSNIAIAKYKVKQFDEAAEFFNKSANLNLFMTGKKDSTSYYNACICAQKAKNSDKIIEYNTDMINQNIAMTYNYQTLYETYVSKKDTSKAIEFLKKGRAQFPNDLYLMNKETETYIQQGKQEDAIINLNKAIEKDPTNAVLEFVLGDVYTSIANPKTKAGIDTIKPSNYEELLQQAETHYLKAIELKPTSTETHFNILYNLGALHYNHGVVLYSQSMNKATLLNLGKQQKEIEAKSNECYKKAVPYFEQALSVKAEDISAMTALRKLYYLTGNEAKGNEMNAKIKAKGN